MKPTFKPFRSRFACLVIRQCICFLITGLSSLPLHGQSKLSGIVQESEGKGIPFANILLLSAKDSSLVKGTVAGESGNYQLENVGEGNYLLAASVVGYRKGYSAPFAVLTGSDHIRQAAIVLQLELQQLEEVSINAQKPLFEQHMDRLVVNVQSSIMAAGSTALDILERAPGISVNRQNSSLSMNGKEGVMVMVNGKLSRLPLSAVIQMLSGMNAANIEKIELITTPPAQYDAEGNAGMINIMLKDNPDYGTNGSYSLNAGYGFFEKAGFNITFNKRTSRLNLFANTSLLWDHYWIQFKNERLVTQYKGLTQTSMVSTRPSYRYVYNTRLGFDYKLTEKTTIGGIVMGFENKFEQFATNTATIISNDQLATSMLIQDHEKNGWAHGMGNLMVHHAFAKDHQISLDLDYLRYYHYNPHSYTHTYQQVEENTDPIDKIKSHMQVPIHLWVAKADYSRPIGKASKLEAGLKATISRLINKANLERLQAGTWHTDLEFTQTYHMLEDIGAAYANFYHQINPKTKLQAGLRYEYTHTHLQSLNQRDLVKRRYGNLFPSVFVSRDLGKESNLQFSFSRRLSRPTYSDLASVFTYFDPYTLLIGNSTLRPAYTNALQAIYGYKKRYLFTLGYSQQTDAINWLVKIDPVANTQITYKDNLTKLNTLSLSLSLPIEVNAWWQMQNHLTTGLQKSIMDYEAKTIYNSRSYGQVNTMHTFRLPADFSVEVSGIYHTRTLFGIAMQKAMGSLNVGIEKKLGKEKGKLQASITDLLWTNRFHYHYMNPSLDMNQSFGARFEPRVFRLTYSRSFGNKNIKPAEKRATGSEEERSRANN